MRVRGQCGRRGWRTVGAQSIMWGQRGSAGAAGGVSAGGSVQKVPGGCVGAGISVGAGGSEAHERVCLEGAIVSAERSVGAGGG